MPTEKREDGFGIVELIVAMTIMALIIMALAPFLVSAFKATAKSIRIAGATEIVNSRIASASGPSVNCADAVAILETGNEVVTDRNRNMEFHVAQVSQVVVSPTNRPVLSVETCQDELDDRGTVLIYYHVDVYDAGNIDPADPKTIIASGKTWIVVK